MNRTIKFALLGFCLAFLAAGIRAQAPQEKFVTVFGAKIRYTESGDPSKSKVILLHGMGGSGDTSWMFTAPALAANYHVITPDQVGFGKSDKPFLNYRIATYVDFLDKFMSELKIEKASLIGNSMGGWVSVMYAAKYPAKVEKLVLVDAGGYAPPKGFDYAALQLNINPSTRDGVRAMVKQLFYNSAMFSSDAAVDNFIALRVAANDGHAIQSLIKNAEHANDYFDTQVKEIKQPTLIVWGKQDGVTPMTDAERLNRDITGSELVVFDQAGHFPQVEKAADFNKKVLEFLAK